ncbi:hypothetical protein [Frankia sp. Cppng1_Ct_nod]|uniref:hypothetical protein n=1 Tax=Frankia sp. Cppng1_Ct_nod TaxID=2897162 RepID=UPI001041B107|nr:hypothetical protein [Frankia sp. Cppng1_Ct_nod]
MSMSPGAPVPDRPRHDVRIGLWGAASSGKTTYLGALKFAAQQARSQWRWKVVAKDPAALSVLGELANVLAIQREFPPATFGNTRLSWSFLGEKPLEQSPRVGSWPTRDRGGGGSRTTARTNQIEVALDLLDVPGGLFDDNFAGYDDDDEEDELDFDGPSTGPSRGVVHAEELVEHLVACDGIIYLFDPIRDEAEGDAYRHFNRMLDEVVSRAFDRGKLIGNRLPHQLAVCVTKFDDPRVLGRAVERHELEKLGAKPGQPKISSDVAFRYFNMLCHDRPDSTARHVRDGIMSTFQADRVRFYATSSIGFYLGVDDRFDPADYANVISEGGRLRIRARLQPMNVLEPLVKMAAEIRKARTGRLV